MRLINKSVIVTTVFFISLFLIPFTQTSASEKTNTNPNATSLPTVSSDPNGVIYNEDQIIIKYHEEKLDISDVKENYLETDFNKSKSLEIISEIPNQNTALVKITDGKSVKDKVTELMNDKRVDFAEPNYKRDSLDINTNDTNRSQLWGLDNTGQTVNGISGIAGKDIDAPEAWQKNEGNNSSVIVAVIDSGVAYNHPDIKSNMWDGANCNDNNGNYMGSCMHGYDFEDNDKIPLPTSSSHGTHIAGTIAAVKNNNMGIIGVAPKSKIMAIKFDYDVMSEIKSIDFAIQNGAKIINASFGGGYYSQAEFDAINRFRLYGGVFVAAAGNDSNNNDVTHFYPSDYSLDNIISVAATDQSDELASFSNFGQDSVDVGAPGTNIFSTIADSTLYSENFETSLTPNIPSSLTKGGLNNNWGTYSLGGGWGNVIYGDLAYPYLNNSNTFITSSTYNLNSSEGASLNFLTQCDTEYITDGWNDYMQLEYSNDGINFVPATDPYFGGNFRWDEVTLDNLNNESPLDASGSASYYYTDIRIPNAYLKDTFMFRFLWVTNSSDNDYDGCLIDNIKLMSFSDGSDELYNFGYSSGTSMAVPHVAGLAALIKGFNPSLSQTQVKKIILDSGDDITSLHSITTSGSRINANKALIMAASPTLTPIFRLYNTKNGAYLYTRGLIDRNYVMNTWPEFEFSDGVPAFYASTYDLGGQTPIYRLYNTSNGAYLYTRGEADRDHVLNTWHEFEFTDGVPAFYANLSDPGGYTPIYRLYNTKNGMYLYTRGLQDRNHVMNTWPEFEFTDGIPAFYATLN